MSKTSKPAYDLTDAEKRDLVEPILGKQYRGVFIPDEELSGGVMQILNYKHSLLKEYNSLRQDEESTLVELP